MRVSTSGTSARRGPILADAAVQAVPQHKQLRLYDGGVYDNLGLEPIFDAGRGQTKHPGDVLIVSDASAPLKKGFSAFGLNPWRFKRLADIIGDQARALRVRTLSHYLQQTPGRGAYIYINTPVTDGDACASVAFAAAFPTTLRRLTLTEFDVLCEHGYRVASRVENTSGLVASIPGPVPLAGGASQQSTNGEYLYAARHVLEAVPGDKEIRVNRTQASSVCQANEGGPARWYVLLGIHAW